MKNQFMAPTANTVFFIRLIQEHSKDLERFSLYVASRYNLHREDAEDLYSIGCQKAWQYKFSPDAKRPYEHKDDPHKDVKAALGMIKKTIENAAKDMARRNGKPQRYGLILDDLDRHVDSSMESTLGDMIPGESYLSEAEIYSVIADLELNDAEQAVLAHRLGEIDDATIDSIFSGYSKGYVRLVAHRVKKKIKEAMELSDE